MVACIHQGLVPQQEHDRWKTVTDPEKACRERGALAFAIAWVENELELRMAHPSTQGSAYFLMVPAEDQDNGFQVRRQGRIQHPRHEHSAAQLHQLLGLAEPASTRPRPG